jgi:hypothetical protein
MRAIRAPFVHPNREAHNETLNQRKIHAGGSKVLSGFLNCLHNSSPTFSEQTPFFYDDSNEMRGDAPMAKFRKGSKVEWAWGKGHASGKVKDVFTESVTRQIKGKKITRHGTEDEPAYLLEQEDGGQVLKSESELHKAESRHAGA